MKALLLMALPILSFSSGTGRPPSTLGGVVLDAASGQPLEKAYVYTVKGEEEALTNSRGAFSLKTWQVLPVTLTVQHLEGGESRVKVTAPTQKLRILLPRQ